MDKTWLLWVLLPEPQQERQVTFGSLETVHRVKHSHMIWVQGISFSTHKYGSFFNLPPVHTKAQRRLGLSDMHTQGDTPSCHPQGHGLINLISDTEASNLAMWGLFLNLVQSSCSRCLYTVTTCHGDYGNRLPLCCDLSLMAGRQSGCSSLEGSSSLTRTGIFWPRTSHFQSSSTGFLCSDQGSLNMVPMSSWMNSQHPTPNPHVSRSYLVTLHFLVLTR